MKKLLFIIMFVLFSFGLSFADRIPVPSGSIRWDNFRDNYFNVQTEELYNFLGAVDGQLPESPTFDSLIISGTGNSWLELGNNTSFTDVLTGKGGYGILNWLPYAILNGEQKRLALFEELGSFAFDTFPTYEDSAHSSGIAVNGTTLAVYSTEASKWLTVALTDSLDPTPVLYTLTVTDPGNGDVISSTDTYIDCGDGATDCAHDYAADSTPELTATPASGREFTAWTGDATDTSTTTNPDTITMDGAKSVGATFTLTEAGIDYWENFEGSSGLTWTDDTDSGTGGTISRSATHSGTFACTDKGSYAAAIAYSTTTAADCYMSTPVTYTEGVTYYLDFWINVTSSGALSTTGDTAQLWITDDTADPAYSQAAILYLSKTSTGVAFRGLKYNNTTLGTTADITLNTWYRITIEIRNNASGTGDVVGFSLNGTSFGSNSVSEFLNIPAYMAFGKTSTAAYAKGVSFEIDNIQFGTTLPTACPE